MNTKPTKNEVRMASRALKHGISLTREEMRDSVEACKGFDVLKARSWVMQNAMSRNKRPLALGHITGNR